MLLADVQGIVVKPTSDGHWTLALPPPAPDVGVRRALIGTATISDLLCGPRPPACGTATPPPPDPDAGGPRINPASVTLGPDGGLLVWNRRRAGGGQPGRDAISVTAYDEGDGWYDLEIRQVAYDAATKTATVNLKESLDTTALLRLVVSGTGPTLVLNADQIPLAGAAGGPPVSIDGRDFVFMKKGT